MSPWLVAITVALFTLVALLPGLTVRISPSQPRSMLGGGAVSHGLPWAVFPVLANTAIVAVPNAMREWWMDIMHCDCEVWDWLPCCRSTLCPQRPPLLPFSFGVLHSHDAIAYHVAPCRRISLATWRRWGFRVQDGHPFQSVLPNHPSFGFYQLMLLEKLLSRQRGDKAIVRATNMEEHLGITCAMLLQLAASPRTGMSGWRMRERLWDEDGALTVFANTFLADYSIRWSVAVRRGWNRCLFGSLADVASFATSAHGFEPPLLNATRQPTCSRFATAERFLEDKTSQGNLKLEELEELANMAQQYTLECYKGLAPSSRDAHWRISWLLDGRGMFKALGNLGHPALPTREISTLDGSMPPPRSGQHRRDRRLHLCDAKEEEIPQIVLANGAAEAYVLGATIVAGAVEIALFMKTLAPDEESAQCVPLVDAVAGLSLPHVALVAWQCVFEGRPTTEHHAAAVLSYFGSEAVVRCQFPPALDPSEPFTLSLVPDDKAVQAEGWAVDLHFCSEPPTDARWKLAVCSQPMYGIDGRDDELRQWLEYHQEEAGVQHYFLYDTDGSLASAVAPYVARGVATYISHWPRRFGEDYEELHLRGAVTYWGPKASNVTRVRYPSALATQAETHCLFKARYQAEYVLFLHSLDAYLSWPGGPAPAVGGGQGGLRALLDRLNAERRRELASLSFRYYSMGGVPQSGVSGEGHARLVIERFVFRSAKEPTQVIWTESQNDDVADDWLQAAQPVVVPENVVGVVGSHWARGRPGTVHVDIDPAEARIHHYIDLVSPRCKTCTLLEEAMRLPGGRLRRRLLRGAPT